MLGGGQVIERSLGKCSLLLKNLHVFILQNVKKVQRQEKHVTVSGKVDDKP
jgi:hypothetical protein